MKTAVSTYLDEMVPTREQDERVFKKLSRGGVFWGIDGNFTVCILRNGRGRFAWGVAKRNPNDDEQDVERGVRIAFVRAYRNFRLYGWQ